MAPPTPREVPGVSLRAALVVAVLLLAMSAATAWIAGRDYDLAVDALARSARIHRTLDDLVAVLVEEQAAERGYLLTLDREFLEPIARRDARLRELMPRAREQLERAGLGRHVAELDEAVGARTALTDRAIALIQSGHRDEARVLIATDEGHARMDRVSALVRSIEDENDEAADVLVEDAAHARTRAAGAFAVMVIVSFALVAYALRSVWQENERLARSHRAVEERERRFRDLAEASSDLVRMHDAAGRPAYVSPSASRLLGYAPDEVLALASDALIVEADRAMVAERVAASARSTEPTPPVVHRMRHRDGSIRWFETRVLATRDEAGAITGFQTSSHDVTAQKQTEMARESRIEELRTLSTRDELTGLLNRRGLTEAAATLFARADREQRSVLVLFCDLNGLKLINDRIGHDAGDHAIRDAATLLRETARESDLVARVGGDEMVIVGEIAEADDAVALEARVVAAARARNEGDERPFRLSLSVGSAVRAPGASEDLAAMMARADQAMYAQKRVRRGATRTASGEHIIRAGAEAEAEARTGDDEA